MNSQEPTVLRERMFELLENLRLRYGDRASQLDSANEAKTRLLLIDEALGALGWSRDDFNPEESAGRAGYLDYLLSSDGIPRLVVEAKKVGHTFGIPRRPNKKNHYQLRTLRSAYGPALTAVLDQARSYSMEMRVPFAVITNGGEWILVQLVRAPGFNTIDELRAVYFGNLLTDNFRFGLFWDLLCRLHVDEGHIESYFAELNAKEADYCRSPQARFGTLQWRRQPAVEHLREFYDRFFDEIIDPRRRAMLEKCFVSNSELDHYQGELQRTLRDTAPAYVRDAIEISPKDRNQLINTDTGDKKGRVVLVTGSVGCGKTTLVHKVLVEARQDELLICVIIDLINEITLENTDVPAVLWEQLAEKWRDIVPESYTYEQLTRIFQSEIASLKSGAQANLFKRDESELIRQEAELLKHSASNPRKFLPACWRYYQQRRKGIIVVFDNVDRASQSYQEKVYTFAHALADNTGATVIVTMREFTFFRGRAAGFLDVRSSDLVFHLQSPNVIQILSRRIKYIETHIDEDYRVREWRRMRDWIAFRTTALNHALVLKNVFLKTRAGQDRLSILEAVSWHNIRYFLQTLRQVHIALGSSSQSWTIPEIVASLMTPSALGNTVLNNIFRPSYPHFKCYYLKLRLLLILIYGQQEYETRRGTSYNRLLTLLSFYGYHTYWTKRAITELVRERFLECLEAPAEEEYTKDYIINAFHSFRPSPLAVVLVEQLVSEPVYLCLIGNDLPFHNPRNIDLYETALNEVYEALGSHELERDIVDLLPATLGKIVAKYLVDMFGHEQPPENLLNHIPEIGAAEDQLSHLVKRLQAYADVSVPKVQRHGFPTQPSLFPEGEPVMHRTPETIIRIPDNIGTLRIGRSEQGPLIFWALVQLKHQGIESAAGVDITRVINDHLVDDHNKKAPNNISRALRSKTLQNQPWLVTKRISERNKQFGLKQGWEKHWLAIFGTAPSLE